MFNVLISNKTDKRNIEKLWNLESIGINIKEAKETERKEYLKSYQENFIEFRDNIA